jgi:hypothetical protein
MLFGKRKITQKIKLCQRKIILQTSSYLTLQSMRLLKTGATRTHNMKKMILAAAIAFGMGMAACSTDDVTANQDESLIVSAAAARSASEGDTVTKKQCKGKLTSVATADLPAAIATYINTNYAGATVKFAGKDDQGKFVVGIDVNGTPVGILFNADGTFSKLLERYGKKAKLTEVAAADLPASVTSYISSNYAGYTVKKAGKDGDGVLFVSITNGTNRKVVQFDATGKFVKELEAPKKGHGWGDANGNKPKGGR